MPLCLSWTLLCRQRLLPPADPHYPINRQLFDSISSFIARTVWRCLYATTRLSLYCLAGKACRRRALESHRRSLRNRCSAQ
ncbi:hypothetical protein K402DRAFT_273496 [Aulographum hederae CBS 113979]|uniref:Uncharacterized protein n=1 Tax=Aulographum hederae CBS 113979 TaxID=1176131 RepID=A0A6G1H956_9PEZI|nr:hypothetical protein K402DRAFT_273496 [Aulographum hederae CBS 113979]